MTDSPTTPQSDRDKLKALLESWSVAYEHDPNDGSITVEGCGYRGFFTYFNFTHEGKFREMGAAE